LKAYLSLFGRGRLNVELVDNIKASHGSTEPILVPNQSRCHHVTMTTNISQPVKMVRTSLLTWTSSLHDLLQSRPPSSIAIMAPEYLKLIMMMRMRMMMANPSSPPNRPNLMCLHGHEIPEISFATLHSVHSLAIHTLTYRYDLLPRRHLDRLLGLCISTSSRTAISPRDYVLPQVRMGDTMTAQVRNIVDPQATDASIEQMPNDHPHLAQC